MNKTQMTAFLTRLVAEYVDEVFEHEDEEVIASTDQYARTEDFRVYLGQLETIDVARTFQITVLQDLPEYIERECNGYLELTFEEPVDQCNDTPRLDQINELLTLKYKTNEIDWRDDYTCWIWPALKRLTTPPSLEARHMSTHYPEAGYNQSFVNGHSVLVDGKAAILIERRHTDAQDRMTFTVTVGMYTIHEFTVTADEIEVLDLDT